MGGIITDLKLGLAFCTRLPIAFRHDRRLADAAWSLPLAGAIVGASGGLVYWIAASLGLSAFVAATLAIATTALLTGCLHEDGLADTADGFGGGHTRARVLEIMRDSQIGTYGAVALVLSFSLRIGALASLPSVELAVLALIGANGSARAVLPFLMRALRAAREDGLSAGAGVPNSRGAAAAIVIGLFVLLLCLGLAASLWTLVLMGVVLSVFARLACKKIGGQTGDVLGAMEQAGEIIVLVVAAALW